MNHLISDRINNFPVSATLAMAAKARALNEQGKNIISLSLGEPDFNTPDFIKDAAKQAIDDNYSSYSPVNGYLDLRQAICHKFKRDNNLTYTADQIVVSTGAKQSLSNIVMALVNPGDEVLLPAPYWVSYDAMVNMAEGISIEIPSTVETDFKITPAQLEAAITPKTKLVFFNSPNNPSGTVYSKAEYRALADVLAKHPNIFIISDEIYEHIIYKGTAFSFAAFEDMYHRTITVNGLSKAFAMTGWRLGYIGAPKFIAQACEKMQGQITSGTNSITQRAAIVALEAPVSSINYMVEEFKRRRDLVYQLLSEINGFKLNKPDGAFYFFPDVSYFFGKTIKGQLINNASAFSMLLLGEIYVATVSGESFGAPNCLRVSYATSEAKLREAISRMKTLLNGI
ncbi:MAG: aspartate aminotransferase [Flavobacteriales bacterium CG_4_10_14_0_2_um_filter_35_18]|nr:MAG: aspartate aminotransferase [Flavobacteriales bacterium CG_4_10_14_0_2_um_filter_35_18]